MRPSCTELYMVEYLCCRDSLPVVLFCFEWLKQFTPPTHLYKIYNSNFYITLYVYLLDMMMSFDCYYQNAFRCNLCKLCRSASRTSNFFHKRNKYWIQWACLMSCCCCCCCTCVLYIFITIINILHEWQVTLIELWDEGEDDTNNVRNK